LIKNGVQFNLFSFFNNLCFLVLSCFEKVTHRTSRTFPFTMASASVAEAEDKTSAEETIARAKQELAYAREQGEKSLERQRIVQAKIVLIWCRELVRFNESYMQTAEELAQCERKNRSRYLRLKKQKVTLWKEVTNLKQRLRRCITEYVIRCSRNTMDRLIDVRQLLGVNANNLALLFSKGKYIYYKTAIVDETFRLVCLTDPDDDEAIERGELKIGILGFSYAGQIYTEQPYGVWYCYGSSRHWQDYNGNERADLKRKAVWSTYLDQENRIIEFETSKRELHLLPNEKVQLPFDLIKTAKEILERKAYRPKSVFNDRKLNLRIKVPLFHIRKILDTELFRMVFFNKTSSVYDILPVDVLKDIYERVLEPYR
jgi:hypothetical protein